MTEILNLPQSPNPKVPPVAHPFRVCTPVQTRFNDIDILGHINNSVYFQFLDLGKIEYFKTVLPEKFTLHNINVVIVNVNCNFFSPGFMDEPLAVYTSCFRISRRSLTLEQRIINSRTGDVKCIAETVMAGFDPATNKGMELVNEWADSMAKFENIQRTEGHS